MAATTFQKNGPGWGALYEAIKAHPNWVMLWRLNELTGEPIIEVNVAKSAAITAALNGSPTRGVSLGNGLYGMTFASASAHRVSLGVVSALGFLSNSPFSVLSFDNVTNDANAKYLVSREGESAGHFGWALRFDSDEKLRFILGAPGAGAIQVTSAAALTAGALINPGVSYSGSGAASGVLMYKNGTAISTTTVADNLTGDPVYTAVVAYIGASELALTETFAGTKGPGALFDAALPASDFADFAHLVHLK